MAGAMAFVLNVQTAIKEVKIVYLTIVSVGVVPENERKIFVDDPDTIYKVTTKAISQRTCLTIPPIFPWEDLRMIPINPRPILNRWQRLLLQTNITTKQT